MSQLRILHTIRQGNFGGGESHVLDLVKHLNKDRFDSYVLTFSEGKMHDKLRELNIPSYVIESKRPFDLRIRNKVRKLARHLKIDIVHAHGSKACSNCYYLASDLNLPLVYTVHAWSFRTNMSVMKQHIRKFSERILCRAATRVINVSQSDFMTGKEHFNLTNSVMIPNGVDFKVYNGRYDHSQKYQLGFRKDDFIVSLIARITYQKDPLTFVRALAEIRNEPRIKGLIVGDGDLMTETTVLINKLHLQDKIVCVGNRTDVPQILSWVDVYCLPSLWEGMPIGILEAMSSGAVVVATDVPGTIEIVHEENGILFEPGDFKALARVIRVLSRKKDFREYLKKNALMHIKRHFTIKRMVKRVASQYSQLAKD